jgi:hypothetical protein
MPDRLNHIGIPALPFHQIALDRVASQVPVSRRIDAATILIRAITRCHPRKIRADDP